GVGGGRTQLREPVPSGGETWRFFAETIRETGKRVRGFSERADQQGWPHGSWEPDHRARVFEPRHVSWQEDGDHRASLDELLGRLLQHLQPPELPRSDAQY